MEFSISRTKGEEVAFSSFSEPSGRIRNTTPIGAAPEANKEAKWLSTLGGDKDASSWSSNKGVPSLVVVLGGSIEEEEFVVDIVDGNVDVDVVVEEEAEEEEEEKAAAATAFADPGFG